tara:strand:+ start:378 stop:1232 length:855 start_codon:yes stop_codon:yes gene_type:complete
MSNIINGKEVANSICQQLKETIERSDVIPCLAVIIVGNRTDSKTYVRMKRKRCKEIGIESICIELDENVIQEQIIEHIHLLNNNTKIHGILVQLPLPKHIDEKEVLKHISENKDVDGFHYNNIGKLAKNENPRFYPCTPEGCVTLLDHYNIEISGQHVVVVGRSNIVGLPLALMLLHRNATITICHSKTKNLNEILLKADIIIAACGKAEMIQAEWVKNGVVVIDVGINRVDDITKKRGYRLVGDVNFKNVSKKASYITPVPGGVGPMTIALLLKHTVENAINF